MARVWRQDEFNEFCATLPQDRRMADAEFLDKMFDTLSRVPHVAQALEWARTHGIKFFVDRKAVGYDGYYVNGTGVVTICLHGVDRRFQYGAAGSYAETLVHELRHAWQDWHGLLPDRSRSLSNRLCAVAVFEADAFAHGKLARRQWTDMQLRKAGAGAPAQKTDVLLENGFRAWFSGVRPRQYGQMTLKKYGHALQLPHFGVFDYGTELPLLDARENDGVNLSSLQDVLKFARGFNGAGDYMTDKKFRDFLQKHVLSPTAALSFYAAAQPPSPAALIVQREYIKKNRQHRAASGQDLRIS